MGITILQPTSLPQRHLDILDLERLCQGALSPRGGIRCVPARCWSNNTNREIESGPNDRPFLAIPNLIINGLYKFVYMRIYIYIYIWYHKYIHVNIIMFHPSPLGSILLGLPWFHDLPRCNILQLVIMSRSKHYTEDHQFQWQSLSKGVTWVHPGTTQALPTGHPESAYLFQPQQTCPDWALDGCKTKRNKTYRLLLPSEITCSDLKQLGSTFEEKRARYPVSKWTTPLRKIRVAPLAHPSACDNCFTAKLLSDPLAGECVLQLVVSMGCPSNLGCSLAVTSSLKGNPRHLHPTCQDPDHHLNFGGLLMVSLHPLNATNSVLSATAFSSTTETKENTWACLKMRYL